MSKTRRSMNGCHLLILGWNEKMNTQVTKEGHIQTKEGAGQASFNDFPLRGRRVALIILAMIAIAAISYFALSRRGAREGAIAAPGAADAGGIVKFLMEQQWRIRMMLAL